LDYTLQGAPSSEAGAFVLWLGRAFGFVESPATLGTGDRMVPWLFREWKRTPRIDPGKVLAVRDWWTVERVDLGRLSFAEADRTQKAWHRALAAQQKRAEIAVQLRGQVVLSFPDGSCSVYGLLLRASLTSNIPTYLPDNPRHSFGNGLTRWAINFAPFLFMTSKHNVTESIIPKTSRVVTFAPGYFVVSINCEGCNAAIYNFFVLLFCLSQSISTAKLSATSTSRNNLLPITEGAYLCALGIKPKNASTKLSNICSWRKIIFSV